VARGETFQLIGRCEVTKKKVKEEADAGREKSQFKSGEEWSGNEKGRNRCVWSEPGQLLREMQEVMTRGYRGTDTETMKQCRKLFREDFKGYLTMYERLLKEEGERLRLELEVLKKREVVDRQEEAKKEAVSVGPQERTVEELIKGLVKALG
jgi:hypothetical protein